MSSSNTKTKSILETTWDYLRGRRPKGKVISDNIRERIGGNQVGDFLLGAITKTYMGDMKEAADDLMDKRIEAQNRIKYSFSQSPAKTRYEKSWLGTIQPPLKPRIKHLDYEALPLTQPDQEHWEKNELPTGCMLPESSARSGSELAYRINQGMFPYFWSLAGSSEEYLVGTSMAVAYSALRSFMAKDAGQRYREEKRQLSELEQKIEDRSTIDLKSPASYSDR